MKLTRKSSERTSPAAILRGHFTSSLDRSTVDIPETCGNLGLDALNNLELWSSGVLTTEKKNE
jgi:hypothetical protein